MLKIEKYAVLFISFYILYTEIGFPSVKAEYADGRTSGLQSNPGAMGMASSNEMSKTPIRKKVNFKTTKVNVGYLYNVGTKKFIAEVENNNLKALDPTQKHPLLVTIVTTFSNSIGTYQEIIAVRNPTSPQLGTANYYDPHYSAKRFDVYGGLGQYKLGLYYTTTVANRMSISPPYYKDESSFKIQISKYCLSIDKDDYLVKGECVDDASGVPTAENDRQLFEFCSSEKIDACLA
ncbi:hypothetical protein NECID01_1467 [Nematocida sp. AWRm77]|nr:hypothetical protein NECID01_1467 [Nematocida sp. AWRm77]